MIRGLNKPYYGKEVISMKKYLGYVVVGLTGYFIGFYEMKYKTLKALTEVVIEKLEEEKE